jgi:sugar porter (SP) family MFS transporter
MTLFAIKEDRPTPKEVYNWRVIICAVISSFASCAIGYDSAFIGTTLALPSFMADFKFDTYSASGLANLESNIVSIYQAGAFFGSLAAYVTSYFLGRKFSLYLYVVPFIIGAGMNIGAMAGNSLGLIIGGRVLTGWGVGGCSSVVPIYLSELSPPAIRGRLVGSWEIGWQIGGVVGFWINYGVQRTMAPSAKQWVIPFAIQLIPVGILFLGCFYIPESPRWLIAHNKRGEGIRALTWIRNLPETDIYIIEEVNDIDLEIERSPVSLMRPFHALKHRHYQWRFVIGGLLFLFQNASGINAINYFSPTVSV